MPTIFRYANIRFYFYPRDHRPIHVHVEKDEAQAKIQVEGEVRVISNDGFSDAAIRKIEDHVKKLQKRIILEWEAIVDEE